MCWRGIVLGSFDGDWVVVLILSLPSSDAPRNNIGIRRGGPGFKKGPNSTGVAGNMRISVVNDSSK